MVAQRNRSFSPVLDLNHFGERLRATTTGDDSFHVTILRTAPIFGTKIDMACQTLESRTRFVPDVGTKTALVFQTLEVWRMGFSKRWKQEME